MVGKTGFEPATPWSQTKCSTKLSYFPIKYGAPERSRTHNLLIRSQTLYPIELRAHYLYCKKTWCRGPESNRYGSHLPQDFKSCASASSATPATLERKTGFEPATPTLARWCSTTELLPRYEILFCFAKKMVRVKGVEPPRLAAPDPKSGASANSATPAYCKLFCLKQKNFGEP